MDEFDGEATELDSPARKAFVIVPNDVNDLPFATRGIFVGVAGDITLEMVDPLGINSAKIPILFKNIAAGTILPLRVSRIHATGTVALAIVGLI